MRTWLIAIDNLSNISKTVKVFLKSMYYFFIAVANYFNDLSSIKTFRLKYTTKIVIDHFI